MISSISMLGNTQEAAPAAPMTPPAAQPQAATTAEPAKDSFIPSAPKAEAPAQADPNDKFVKQPAN
jgi:hypothetical protein